ncbi:hypothetical protein PQE75_gp148 [Bacillus phage vB_BcoS-136]|uniref:Uncharacterized protein n=1 Tax=Bacillus phage vB_BcoS-136 TaxID=2419619 RepID=A0A3G3BW84_9CAUD|nr:hypothetical protein PQE75_gp148 [Bacillus phage vB_BcoS-136]AYP68331.1 hypothetical protein vBBcoS136_00217 [Bacillus phage vB_BcoS-136]
MGKSLRFSPITNCSIELDGVRHNIQVLTRDKLIALMVKLHAYEKSAKELKLLDHYTISGFSPSDWMGDIQSRINILSRAEEEKSLKAMEDKLLKLLSERKKVELEIDEIESMIKGI